MTSILLLTATALISAGLAALLVHLLGRRPVIRHLNQVVRDLERSRDLHQATLEAVTQAIDERNPASRGHARRVQAYALELAQALALPAHERQALRTAALLHDVGQVVVPEHVLGKPGRLSEAEFEKMKAHPGAGAEILAPAGLPVAILGIVRHHHERWDGSGYPDGLRGDAIPIGARVLAVADAFEALTSDRSYRARLEPKDALEVIATWSGVQFDPAVVEALRGGLDAVIAAAQSRAAAPGAASTGAGAAHPAGSWTAGPVGGSAGPDAGGFGDALHQGIARLESGQVTAPAPRTPLVTGPTSGVRDAYAVQREVFALYEIAQTLASTPRLTEVLDLVVSRIAQLVPFRTCAVYLAQPGGEGLSARFVSGANAAALRGRRLRRGEGISGWAAEHRSSRFSGTAELDLADTGIDTAGYSTVAAFPLCQGDETLGVITLYYPAAAPCLEEHVRLMEIVARLAAGAVANGRMASASGPSTLTDEVTHLPSARYLEQVFERETIRSQQSGHPFAVLEMDLDAFRGVNERFGQEAGDRFLMEIGRVLRSHLRERDVLVRLGEDEYAALLPGSGFAAAAVLAERLQQAVDGFALRLSEEGPAARAGLSAGIAIYPLDGERLDDLLQRAALNRARNKYARREARTSTPNVVPFRSPGGGDHTA
jgi:diguanylate cyclase (GGDEF)-like protein/putative nucleotidyltransferase with HDIG domain